MYFFFFFPYPRVHRPRTVGRQIPQERIDHTHKIRRCLPSWEACDQRASEHEVQRSQTVWQFLLAPEHISLQLL